MARAKSRRHPSRRCGLSRPAEQRHPARRLRHWGVAALAVPVDACRPLLAKLFRFARGARVTLFSSLATARAHTSDILSESTPPCMPTTARGHSLYVAVRDGPAAPTISQLNGALTCEHCSQYAGFTPIPIVRFSRRPGIVSYFTRRHRPFARRPGHNIFLSVGHDEYGRPRALRRARVRPWSPGVFRA